MSSSPPKFSEEPPEIPADLIEEPEDEGPSVPAAAPAAVAAPAAESEVPEVLVAQVASISETFARQIDEALQGGDPARARSLVIQMRQQMTRIMHPDQPAELELVSSPLYNPAHTSLDLWSLVLATDREKYGKLTADPGVSAAIETIESMPGYVPPRARVLSECLRLTQSSAPKLHDAAKVCRHALGFKPAIELFAHRDPLPRAIQFASEGGISIAISSPLLARFDEDEIRFVIGAQLGHYLFEHERLPARELLAQGRNSGWPVQAVQLQAWKVSAEMSADRLGLLCCRSMEAAARALFKLSTGVVASLDSFQIASALREIETADAEWLGSETPPLDLIHNQPFGPIRLKALDLFHRSELYRRIIGLKGGDLTEARLESEMIRLTSFHEPSCLREDQQVSTLARKFLFVACLSVVGWDGAFSPGEALGIGDLVFGDIPEEKMRELAAQSVDARRELLKELGSEIRLMTSTLTRYAIVRDLAILSLNDGRLNSGERRAIAAICRMIDVPAELADHVARVAARPLT